MRARSRPRLRDVDDVANLREVGHHVPPLRQRAELVILRQRLAVPPQVENKSNV